MKTDVAYWIALVALFVAVVALRKAYAVEGRLLPGQVAPIGALFT